MLTNEAVALSTSKVLLVPYCSRHVLTYHEWMKDPNILEATASEPLTVDEEYSMQESWRKDSDKLTFIICQPVAGLELDKQTIVAGIHDSDEALIGDVNMFITTHDEEEGEAGMKIVGELELMVAAAGNQGKGFGRSALLTFLRYVLEHEKDIVDQFLAKSTHTGLTLSYFCAKVGERNLRSIGLFESLGFVKTSAKPSYFGEYELRFENLSLEGVDLLLQRYNVERYVEIGYDGGDRP